MLSSPGGLEFLLHYVNFCESFDFSQDPYHLNLRPVLMMTKKRWSTKIFAGIIHVFPNATTPEQYNLKFTNTLLCIICHLDFRTSWKCHLCCPLPFVCRTVVNDQPYHSSLFFAVLKTSIVNITDGVRSYISYRIFPFLIIYIDKNYIS